MKKYFRLLSLVALIIALSACTISGPREKAKTNAESEIGPLFSEIKALFEEADAYERYYTTPTFACKTPPDEKLRIKNENYQYFDWRRVIERKQQFS